MLKIKNLTAVSADKALLKNINLKVNAGEIHAVMGPKFSGKTALAHVISGHPGIIVSEGDITYKRKKITTTDIEDRYHAGIFTTFQYPPEYEGITNWGLTKAAITNKDPAYKDLSVKYLTWTEVLSLGSTHGEKLINGVSMNISEAKRNEIVLLVLSNPDLIILDEIDQGLSEDEIVIVGSIIKELTVDNKKACIVITHSHLLLQILQPSHVHVMVDGAIMVSGGAELHKRIVEDGYPEFL
jgi:Fe-S cluster assembly ATP-binding protein